MQVMDKYFCMLRDKYDVVIAGAGHNGLVAACYLARAGMSVLMLEKNNSIGGASVSARVFPEFDVRLSRYAYLVSLFPRRILSELDVNVTLLRRSVASYTPFADGGGLLLGGDDCPATISFFLSDN